MTTERQSDRPEGLSGKIIAFLAFALYPVLVVLGLVVAFVRWVIGRFRALKPERRKPRRPQYWANVRGNQFTHPEHIALPKTLDELRELIGEAVVEGRRVRAIGSGHSFSDVAVCDDVVVDMSELNVILDHRASQDDRLLVTAEAGITIEKLNRELDQLGLALPNMGSADFQTLSGAISTATHGSGAGFGSLADLVVSMHLLTGNPQEPEVIVAPSDEALAAGDLAENRPERADVKPICDDDVFNSAVVAMGSMGVVYSYTIRVVKAHKLAENRRSASWAQVKDMMKKADFFDSEDGRRVEIYVNPYRTRAGRECLVTTRTFFEGEPRGRAAKTRNPLAAQLTTIRIVDRIILWFFRTFPSLTRNIIQIAMRGLVDERFVAPSYKVLNLGGANDVPAYSAELGFDASDVSELIRQVETLLQHIEQASRGRDAIRLTSPLSLRFVAESHHLLSPQHGRRTCMIEVVFIDGTPHGMDLLRYLERRMGPVVRPHWGQANFLCGAPAVAARYPGFEVWRETFHRFNPTGTFDNAFTDRLGLRDPPSSAESTA